MRSFHRGTSPHRPHEHARRFGGELLTIRPTPSCPLLCILRAEEGVASHLVDEAVSSPASGSAPPSQLLLLWLDIVGNFSSERCHRQASRLRARSPLGARQMRCCHGRLAASLAVILASVLVLGAAGMPAPAPLRFTPDGRFKVALFADLHYGENAWTDWGSAQDDGSDRVMAAVLDAEKPDLVVYLDDQVTANNLPIPNATLYWDRVLSPTRRRGIPWATIFGNHDDMSFEWPPEWFSPAGIPPVHCPPSSTPASRCSFRGTPRMELITAEINRDGAGLSHSSVGPQELWPGVSNYVLQVLSREEREDPALLMYFLDSGGGSYPEVISGAQVRWFQGQSQFLNPDGRSEETCKNSFWTS
uniref:Uncharacterized protein n=1 Tax=Avena sativa TaxID=4498 RepID=A0ACD5XFX3_AVESA